MAELQIVYLIVVGGFQLMFVKKIILWIFKKKVKIGRIVATSVLLFYCYLLNFSVASLRVILCMLIANSNKVKNKFDIIGIAGALTLIISPSSVFNIGFCLSYLCTVSILIVTTISFDSELIKQICINASCLIVSIPFVLKISSQISIWSLLFCLIFSHIFVLIYIFYLFNFILLWFWPVILTWTSSIIFYGLKTLADSNTLVTLPSFGALGTTIYLLLISAVFIFAIKHFNVECSKNNVQLNRKEERDIFI
jgi:competence protein ComEC